MALQSLVKSNGGRIPAVFDEFLRPWNDWLENPSLFSRELNIPGANITEHPNEYVVSLAVPGMKKSDFNIDISGNMLTISSEQEEKIEEKEKRYTRKEYNYSSLSRSFTLPDEVNKEKIEAKYEDGILKLTLPRKEEAKSLAAKHIAVK